MQDIRPIDDELENRYLYYGLEKVGFSREQVQETNRDVSLHRFVSFFGVCPRTCTDIFSTLKEADSFRSKPSLLYFFMSMAWLKTYMTERVLAGMFKVHENTVRTWVWKYAKGIMSLKEQKISLDLDMPVPNVFLYSVDCTHCRIEEPRSAPDKKWFSHKLNKPAVSYEIALHLYQNKIAWINGPFQGGEHDITIYRKEAGLKSKIPPGKLLIADRGYIGDNQISTPNEFDSHETILFKRRARARQESFNGRAKEFRILSECFRSDPELHRIAFEAVSVIVQFSMENGRPLMET